jgi:multidrug efflux pump subunit AcrA (membrane-fusion protein)
MKPTRLIRSWPKPKALTERTPIPAPVTTPATAPTVTPTKWDRWFQRAAHASAPLALVLAFVGYWYTVRPVFQYQRLQEQAAKVEMDKAAAEQQLAKLRADQQRITANIQGLQANWEREKARNAQLASVAAAARTREAEAQRRAAEAGAVVERELKKLAAVEAAMNSELGKLDKARWELVIHDYFWQIALPRITRARLSRFDGDDKAGAQFAKIEAGWTVPYESMLSAIEKVDAKNRQSREIPDSYYVELREFIRAREAALRCPNPDFAELRTQYLADMAGTALLIEAEVTRQVEKVRNDPELKGGTVKITDDFRGSLRRAARVGEEYTVQKRHREKIQALEKECDDKIDAVMQDLRQAKGATR